MCLPKNGRISLTYFTATSSSESGLYAGPLRLLAHEISERLNRGQIVPLGMDPESRSEHDTTTNMDVATKTGDRPTVRMETHAKYVRQCNLRTGDSEDFRIVADNAPLISMTAEMASFESPWTWQVVYEIQMVSNPERDSAWTSAVLATEMDLACRQTEETAVPIIRDILKTS